MSKICTFSKKMQSDNQTLTVKLNCNDSYANEDVNLRIINSELVKTADGSILKNNETLIINLKMY